VHGPGRPRIDDEIEQWVVRIAKENADWGYDRIVGAMANLGYRLSDQTVGNILQRHGIPPAPDHVERNDQGKDNALLFPVATKAGNRAERSVSCKERLGGLLKYYHREAA
jgi:hypothetical protein